MVPDNIKFDYHLSSKFGKIALFIEIIRFYSHAGRVAESSENGIIRSAKARSTN